MFDLLQHPPHTPEPVGVGATVSIVTHVAMVFALALGTRQAAVRQEEIRESIVETAIRFLLPPDKRQAPSEEVRSQWASQRAGPAPTSTGDAQTNRPLVKDPGSDAVNDTEGTAPLSLAESAKAQDAFTLIDVDTAVARDPESAAPAYPAQLQLQGIEGAAIVRFVVDTTGRADPESFQVIETNHRLFASAVRDALPGMKFLPARIGSLKVRQLVEQPFVFRIARQVPPPAKKP